jgi:ankyrin repeat protein
LLNHLIGLGVDVNLPSSQGLTPQHYMVLFKYYDLTDSLLNTDKVILSADNKGFTPLHYASRHNGDSKMVKGLLEYLAKHGSLMAARQCNNKNGESSLLLSVMRADKETTNHFLGKGIWLVTQRYALPNYMHKEKTMKLKLISYCLRPPSETVMMNLHQQIKLSLHPLRRLTTHR